MNKAFLTLLFIGCCSCGHSNGFLHDGNTTNSIQYRFDTDDIYYKRTVSGSYNGKSAFCLIPTQDNDYYNKAMQDLYENANLSHNEMIINLREDFSTNFYLFFCSSTLVVSGDVVAMKHYDVEYEDDQPDSAVSVTKK